MNQTTIARKKNDRGVSTVALVFILALAAGIGAAVYYGNSMMTAYQKQKLFTEKAGELRQWLMKNVATSVTPNDVARAAATFAQESGVTIAANSLRVVVEPGTPQTVTKLPVQIQEGFRVAGLVKRDTPYWIVGFEVVTIAKHGWAKTQQPFTTFTWSDDAKP